MCEMKTGQKHVHLCLVSGEQLCRIHFSQYQTHLKSCFGNEVLVSGGRVKLLSGQEYYY